MEDWMTERLPSGFEDEKKSFWSQMWHYILVVLFGLILSMGIWGVIDRTLVGDDYAFHNARLQAASHAWSNGQFLPQVDPDALGGFGYAYNIFYGPILTYLAAGLQALAGSWEIAINLVLIICLVMSGVTMCYAMTKISKSKVLAALTAIFYMAAPYHLTDIYARVALGEVAAFVVAPFLLLGLFQLIGHERHAVRNLALAAALLLLSHSLSAMLFALMAAVFVVLNIDKVFNLRSIWRMVLTVVFALGLSAFFILPLLDAKFNGAEYGVFDEAYSQAYLQAYFGANSQGMNDHRLWVGSMLLTGGVSSMAIGVVGIVGLLGFWFVRKRLVLVTERRFVTSMYLIAVLALVLSTPLIDWRYMPSILWQLQFPWRFLELAAVALSVVAGYTVALVFRDIAMERQKVCVVIAGMLAICSVTEIFLPDFEKHLPVNERAWAEIAAGSVGWEAEYAPKQLLCADNAEELAQGYTCSLEKIEAFLAERGVDAKILDGQAEISAMKKDGLMVDFEIKDVMRVTEVELPLIYYPGYMATLGDERLDVKASEEHGLVTVTVPAGSRGEVKVWFGLSNATKIGLMVSGMTAGFGLIWIILMAVWEMHARKKEDKIASIMHSAEEIMDGVALDDDLWEKSKEAAKKPEQQLMNTAKSTAAKVLSEKKAKAQTTTDDAPKPKKKISKKASNSSKESETTKPKAAKNKDDKPKTETKAAKTKGAAITSETMVLPGETKSKVTKVKVAPRSRKEPE